MPFRPIGRRLQSALRHRCAPGHGQWRCGTLCRDQAAPRSRRGGRAVECTGLENRQGGDTFEGSNPSLSAKSSNRHQGFEPSKKQSPGFDPKPAQAGGGAAPPQAAAIPPSPPNPAITCQGFEPSKKQSPGFDPKPAKPAEGPRRRRRPAIPPSPPNPAIASQGFEPSKRSSRGFDPKPAKPQLASQTRMTDRMPTTMLGGSVNANTSGSSWSFLRWAFSQIRDTQ
jgi:hypothetical protein